MGMPRTCHAHALDRTFTCHAHTTNMSCTSTPTEPSCSTLRYPASKESKGVLDPWLLSLFLTSLRAVYVLCVCCACLLCVAVLRCVQSGPASDSLSRLSHPVTRGCVSSCTRPPGPAPSPAPHAHALHRTCTCRARPNGLDRAFLNLSIDRSVYPGRRGQHRPAARAGPPRRARLGIAPAERGRAASRGVVLGDGRSHMGQRIVP